ncbi:hypothetical protein JW756_06070 [Candidatus Woesearchaeota archaeon]|nr:hypothetical protein [Candidatus Woesearchaeota archaeon]
MDSGIQKHSEKELKYTEIIRTEGNFLILEEESKEVFISLHRVRRVEEKEKVVQEE